MHGTLYTSHDMFIPHVKAAYSRSAIWFRKKEEKQSYRGFNQWLTSVNIMALLA